MVVGMMNLAELQRLAALEYALDSVLLDMMPTEMAQIVELAPEALKWSVNELAQCAGRYISAMNELKIMERAIERYAIEAAGMDPMFRQNFSLCRDMIRRGK